MSACVAWFTLWACMYLQYSLGPEFNHDTASKALACQSCRVTAACNLKGARQLCACLVLSGCSSHMQLWVTTDAHQSAVTGLSGRGLLDGASLMLVPC